MRIKDTTQQTILKRKAMDDVDGIIIIIIDIISIFIGTKHCFSCINVCQVPREVNSRGTWQTLMYWKTMFDRCYCIISTKCSVTFAKNVALYFVNV